MSYIPLKDFSPALGSQWNAITYPGDGAYLTPFGIFIVSAGCVMAFNMGDWRGLVAGGDPPASVEVVSVHRLLDQMIALTRAHS